MADLGPLTLAQDADAAGWVIERLREFASSVVAVVPSGFEAYARVFHPARRVEDGGQVAVTWREVAAANGRAAHRAMQWPGIVGAWRLVHGDRQPGLWDSEPEEGSLPVAIAVDLAAALAAYTSTPGRCWFAVWEGFGALAVPPGAAAFNIPQRRMRLLTGPVTAASASLSLDPFRQSANLWWPDDHRWCVATEIDLDSTYVGGSRACVDAIVAHPSLEAVAVEPGDGVTWASDKVNPPPG